MIKRNYSNFLDWLSCAEIYIAHNRYGTFWGHGFLCASDYDYNEELESSIGNLDGEDIEALEAAKTIMINAEWVACDRCPSEAMRMLTEKMYCYWEKMDRAQHPQRWA